MILTFSLFFGGLSLQQHTTYQTHGLDLGNVDQALWNTAQGRFMQFTLMAPVESRLALHVEPILLSFVPFYWLNLGGPTLLLLSQTVIVALGAWPLYRLAVVSYQASGTALPLPRPMQYTLLAFPFGYLMYPPLQSAVLFEFHAVTFAPTFILFALLALEQAQSRRFLGAAVLVMACKEDMPLLIAALGLYFGLAYRQWRLAGITMALGSGWFLTAVLLIQPQFAVGGNIQLDRYAWLGNDLPAILLTLLTQPTVVFDHLWYEANVVDYLRNLLFPVAYLSLLSPLTLIPMLPTLAINLLSDNPFSWRLEDFHYAAPLAPFVFVSAMHGSKRLNHLTVSLVRCLASRSLSLSKTGWFRQAQATAVASRFIRLTALLAILLCSMVYHYHRGYTPLARPFAWPERTAHHQAVAELLETVPVDSPIIAQSNLVPHLTHRQVIYDDFAYFADATFSAKRPVESVILDSGTLKNLNRLHQFLQTTLLPQTDHPIDFRYLTPPTHPTPPPTYQLSFTFGDAVYLHGYTLHFDRQEAVQLSLDLEPRQPLVNIWPILYLLDSQGQAIGATTDLQPALVWHPPETWPIGETIRVHFNTFPWDTRNTQAYRLALGVVHGDDVWHQRLKPRLIQPTELSPRLAAEGNLIELARIEQTWDMPYGGPLRRQFDQPAIAHRLNANFANHLILLGYDEPIINEETLTIPLYWQAGSANLQAVPNLTRFVQLVGSDGQLYSQHDSWPDNGQYPVDLWQPNEVVGEAVSLPLHNLPKSLSYSLHMGLYLPDTGQRLPIFGNGTHIELEILQKIPK